ncbi:hypothetical protein GCM10027063_02970 [Promicromonospora xylanilytica]
MTERTQHDDAAPGSPEPSKVHTFDLIDEVPGVSDGADPDGADRDPEEPATEPDQAAEPAPREAGRVALAVADARAAAGRAARRGGAAVRRRLPTTRRGKMLLVGGTASVVVLAVAAGVLVNAQLRERALLATPGGVRSLAEKPVEQWSIDLDDPISSTLVEMPGVLAVAGDGKVRGVDPASGDVRWTVDVGDGQRCGPTTPLGTGGPAPVGAAAPLVCVAYSATGDGDGTGGTARTVTVIDADGAARTRELDSEALVLPVAGGRLIHLEPTGGDQERRPVVVDKLGAPHLPKDFAGPDLTVRVEDAATGAERWSETVAFGAPRPDSCVTYDENAAPVLDIVGALGWDLQGEVLEVQGCGVSAAFLLDGTRLDDPEDPTDPPADGVHTASFAPLPDGGWVGPDTKATEAKRPDGVHLPHGAGFALDGQVLVPWATDGRDPGLLLERVGVHVEARSTDESDAGARLWSADELRATSLLARVSGTAVVVDEEGAVRAIDLGTGANRWTLDPEVLSFGDLAWSAEAAIFGVYTDGDTLLLPVAADPSGSSPGLRLLAVDLDDGSVRWEIPQDTPYTQLISVDGHLAQITQQGVVGLG